MAKAVFVIFHFFELPNGNLVIGLGTECMRLRDEWRSMNIPELKAQFEGKTIHIFGEHYQFEASVLGIDILNSLIDFKNVFLKLDHHAFATKIQLNDRVEVDLKAVREGNALDSAIVVWRASPQPSRNI